MGICWDGAEEQFEALLLAAATSHRPFHYLEVGVAYCQTMKAVYDALVDARHPAFRMTGIDPEPIPQAGHQDMLIDPRVVIHKSEACWVLPLLEPVHFAVIDGCHAEPCVTGDFLGVEEVSVPGTIVVFHDFQELAQGGDFQPHCGQMVGVRKALQALGLLDNTRPRWCRLPDLHGDPSRNGADCGVFRHE